MGSLPRLIIGLLAFAGVTAAAPRAAFPDPAAIAAANGHPALQHRRLAVRSLHDGRMVDLTVDFEGIRRLERACIGPVCNGNWFDGRTRYTFGPNGTPLPDDDADMAFWRTYCAVVSLAWTEPSFVASGGRVRALGGDATNVRYEVRAESGSALVAVVDARTLAPAGIERRAAPDADPEVIADARFGDAAAVGEPLAAPPPAAPHIAGSEAVELLRATIPVVPCSVRGIKARCAIDTGTTPTAMTLAFAEKLGLEPQGELVVSGFTRGATGIVETGPLTIGPATWPALRYAIAALAGDLGFDVLIGNDLVAATPMRLDARTRRLTFGASGSGTPLALYFHDGAAYTRVSVRGRERTALFDLGDTATISLGYDDFRREFSDLPIVHRSEARGIGGGSDAFYVQADSQAAGVTLGRTTVRVTRTQHGAHLGWGFAQHCPGGVSIDEGARRAVCVTAP